MDQEIIKEEVTTTKQVAPAVRVEHPQKVFEKKKAIFRTYQIIWYVLAVIEILLVFRMILKALGANSQSGFTSFIYLISNPFALPFSGILPVNATGGAVFEWHIIIAIAVYAIVAYGLVYLLQIIKPVTPRDVDEAV